jgi:DnaK suppressor protein
MPLDLEAIQRALTDEQAKLLDVLRDLGATEDGEIRDSETFQHGFSDAAADTASRREILQLAGKTAEELAAVRHALARLDDGTYGTCERCGNRIGDERLEFRPISVVCIDCKRAEG